jgi:hypothetical protein
LTKFPPRNWHQLELPRVGLFLQSPPPGHRVLPTDLCSHTHTMAATTAELVILSSPTTTDRHLPGRSDSLNSNSSALARRPRIRSRTRTLPDGSCWSDGSGAPQTHSEHRDGAVSAAPRESQVTGGQLAADPVHPPPRPPRSPRRSEFIPENEPLHVPSVAPRERKTSATSTRSVPSTRGATNASLEELLALKSVRDFFFFFHSTLCAHLLIYYALAGHCW